MRKGTSWKMMKFEWKPLDEVKRTKEYDEQGRQGLSSKFALCRGYYFTYILRCSDDSLYTGSTNDLEKRIHEHNHLKSGAHYTKIRRPVELIYMESFETMSEARKREYSIKQLTRAKKILLIHAMSEWG